jgi:anti-sigma factor RsiW
MECQQSQNLMSAYLDGELDAAAAQQMLLHLANCPACHALSEEMHAEMLGVRSTVRQYGTRYTAPAHLQYRIQAALRTSAPAPASRRPLASLPWRWITLAIAGVSSTAFAVLLSMYLALPSSSELLDQELVASHFRSLMPDHLADVASSDQHTVKPWFAGKLDFSPPVYDLAQQGFALIGGRLDYIHGRPVAALAYRHRLHVLNLYLWPDQQLRDTLPSAASRQGYQVLHWTQMGMHFAAVSDMNAQDVAEFSRQIKVQVQQGNP